MLPAHENLHEQNPADLFPAEPLEADIQEIFPSSQGEDRVTFFIALFNDYFKTSD